MSITDIARTLNENLEEISTEFQRVFAEYSELNADILNVSKVVEDISTPVKQLEGQRANAQEVLRKIDDLLSFQDLLKSFKEAVHAEDLARSADLCQRLSRISMPFHIQEMGLFEHLRSQVSERIKSRFSTAIVENDTRTIEKLAGLFIPLGLGKEGGDKYIEFISKHFSSKCEAAVGLILAGDSTQNKYEEALRTIYRTAVTTYDTHKTTFTNEFGNSTLKEFLCSISQGTDEHAINVINNCISQKDMQGLASAVKSGSLGTKLADAKADELGKLIRHSESFENWALLQSDEKASATGKLKGKVQELADFYISVESYFLVNSMRSTLFRQSIIEFSENIYESKENLVFGDPFESLDGSFYLIQKTSQRGLFTLNINAACAVINRIGALLSEELIETLSKQFTFIRGPVSLTKSFTRSISSCIVLLNLLDFSKAYSLKVSGSLETKFPEVFGRKENEMAMFQHCMLSINEASDKAKFIIQERVRQCIKASSNTITHLLSDFQEMDYAMSEDHYIQYSVNDPFALKLVAEIKGTLKQWKCQLTDDNFQLLIDYFAQAIAEHLEYSLKHKGFSEYGVLQFEKDVKEVLNGVQGLASKRLRGRFVRVLQVVQVLQCEEFGEAMALQGTSEWRLTEKETQFYYSLLTR